MWETYGPVIGAAILCGIIIYARHLHTVQKEQNMAWLIILERLAPVILALIPGIPAKLVPVLIEAISAAEESGENGTEKMSAVINAASTVAPDVNVPVVIDAVTAVVKATNATAKAV